MPFVVNTPALSRALESRGYSEPTSVQEAILAPEAAGRDLLVSAQTGSGKTVAFGLALAETLLGQENRFPAAGKPLALIVAPTRELAMQVQRELEWLYRETGARIVASIGGMDPRAESRALESGSHIVVGTPGRLCDHLRRNRLDLSDLRAIVLDEADEMLDLGFREELEALLQAAPETRRTLMFSATIARHIAALAGRYQKNALRIDTLVRNEQHSDIDYRAVVVSPSDMEHAVVNVLRYFEAPNALVFCSRREEVRHLHASLLERGFSSVALSGEMTQVERSRALQSMRDGHARVCVATDVAARGIDLPQLELVIHGSLPTNGATLLHRSGRTGRAGRKGTCVLIVPTNSQRRAAQLLHQAGVEASWGGPPPIEAIRDGDAKRLLEDPVLAEAMAPEDLTLARRLLEGRSAEDIAAALIRLYRARLPAPEDISSGDYQPAAQRPDREQRPPVNNGRDEKPHRARNGDFKKPPYKGDKKDAAGKPGKFKKKKNKAISK